MKLYLYSIYDSAAKVYNRPFYQHTKGQAIRSFTDLVNDEQSELNKHPADYYLAEMGVFEDDSGSLTQPTPPVKVIIGPEVLNDA